MLFFFLFSFLWRQYHSVKSHHSIWLFSCAFCFKLAFRFWWVFIVSRRALHVLWRRVDVLRLSRHVTSHHVRIDYLSRGPWKKKSSGIDSSTSTKPPVFWKMAVQEPPLFDRKSFVRVTWHKSETCFRLIIFQHAFWIELNLVSFSIRLWSPRICF